MPRGFPVILKPSILQSLIFSDPHHPRVRLHYFAIEAVHQYEMNNTFQVIHDTCMRSSSVPIKLLDIVKKFNRHSLNRPSDLKLSAINLFRIIQRKYWPTKPRANHCCIYFKQRKKTLLDSLYTKRRQNIKKKDLDTVTVLFQNRDRIMYSAQNLHCVAHGSIGLNDLLKLRLPKLDKCIMNSLYGNSRSGVIKKNGIQVVFLKQNSSITLNKSMIGGLDSFDKDIVSHLINFYRRKDPQRLSGKVLNEIASYTTRCSFGFGRIQKTEHPGTWFINNVKQPTLNCTSFQGFPSSLKERLNIVMEQSTKFAMTMNPHCFTDHTRNTLFSKKMNTRMGFRDSQSKFEYTEIVLSHNCVLKEHIDFKNDHRHGYNSCIVYSSFPMLSGVEYRLSIIMTSRTTVGSSLEKARKASQSLA